MTQPGDFGPAGLHGLPDAQLVELVQRHGDRAAEAALLDRHSRLITRVVLGEARRQRLPPADWDDALQEGKFALRRAIRDWQPPPPGQARPGRFPCFLARVVLARVRDLGRKVRHHGRHTVPLTHGPAGQEQPEPAAPGADPAAQLQRQEELEQLAQALAELDRAARRVVEAMANDESLRAVARAEHLSYPAARRLRVRALHFLRWRLGGDTEGGDP